MSQRASTLFHVKVTNSLNVKQNISVCYLYIHIIGILIGEASQFWCEIKVEFLVFLLKIIKYIIWNSSLNV